MTEAAKSGSEAEAVPRAKAIPQADGPLPETPTAAATQGTHGPPLPLGKRVRIQALATAASAAVRLIGPTLRYDVLGWQQIERVHASGRRCIYSFWHRSIFLAMWWWRRRGVVAMTSANFDGQVLGRTLERLGFGTTPGSSSRGGLRALAELAKALERNRDATWAADGPRGPRYIAKPGPVLLARRSGCPILPLHLSAERAHIFEKSWDLFQLPHPFSRAVLVVGPPVEVPLRASPAIIQLKHEELQHALERVRDAAESWYALSAAGQQQERKRWNA